MPRVPRSARCASVKDMLSTFFSFDAAADIDTVYDYADRRRRYATEPCDAIVFIYAYAITPLHVCRFAAAACRLRSTPLPRLPRLSVSRGDARAYFHA